MVVSPFSCLVKPQGRGYSKGMTTKSLSVPLTSDFSNRLSNVIRSALDHDGWKFICNNADFTSEEIAAPDGLLPVWIHRAQELMQQGISSVPAHMVYQMDGQALSGVLPAPEGPSASLGVWALFIHYAMEEWRGRFPELVQSNKPVPMDELLENWKRLLASRSLVTRSPKPVPGMLPGMDGVAPDYAHLPLNPINPLGVGDQGGR